MKAESARHAAEFLKASDRDRYFAPSIAAIQKVVRGRGFEGLLEPGLRMPSA